MEISSSFRGWLGGATAPDKEPPSQQQQSLLSDWKSYQSSDGAKSQSISSKLLASAEEGSSSMKKIASGALSSATSVVEGVQGAPGTTQYAYFAAFAGVGVLLLLLAFFVFLPLIIIRPSKFAVTFSLGSVLILLSLGFLRGWKTMIASLSSKERLTPTAAYLGSLIGTLYASMVMHSYIYSITLCIVQLITLAYYVASYFPGGTQGMQFLMGGSLSMVKSLVFRSTS